MRTSSATPEAAGRAAGRRELDRLRKRVRRRHWLGTRWRCVLFILVSLCFLVLQVVLVASFLPTAHSEARELSHQLISSLMRTFIEPTAEAAVAAEPEDLVAPDPPPAPPLPPQLPAPPQLLLPPELQQRSSSPNPAINSTSLASLAFVQAMHQRLDSKKYAWDFFPPTYDFGRGEVMLHGCLGNGTYGAVLNASIRRRGATASASAVVKLPVLRSWGFRFYRTELRGLEAIGRLSGSSGPTGLGGPSGGGVRNVVRM